MDGSQSIEHSEFVRALEGSSWNNPLGEGADTSTHGDMTRIRERARELNIELGGPASTQASINDIIGIIRERYRGKASLRRVFRAWDQNKVGGSLHHPSLGG